MGRQPTVKSQAKGHDEVMEPYRSRIRNFRLSATLEVHQQVAGLLGYPCAGRVGSDLGQVHPACTVPGEEQHVQAAQEHDAGVEEVRGEDRRSLPGQERLPGLAMPPGCRINARMVEDLPHRRRRELVPQAGQFAMDAPVAPGRIIARHLQHPRAHGL